MTPLLEARHLVKSLGGRRVVDGVDLRCHRGEILGLLGPNGAGKTTTLRMLYGFLRPDAGSIRFDGVDVGADLAPVKRQLGVCTQDDTFDGDFSVEQNLTIAARYFRPPVRDLRARVGELLDRFGLGPFAAMRPEALSGGFKRRLMIARALVHRPRLLFLDEPTTGLDPQSRRQLWSLLEGFRSGGGTILLTTHYMDEAEVLCDRIAIVDHGRVIALGTPAELIASLGAAHVVAFALEDGRGALADHELLALPGVHDVIAENGQIQLIASEIHVTVPALLRTLSDRGAQLSLLTTHGATLEDVFVRLTGRHLRDV
jgi:ABC-type multidrug transport system ATPase subunit